MYRVEIHAAKMCANYEMYANVARFTVTQPGHLFEFLEVDHQLPTRVDYTDVTLEQPTACSAMGCERFLPSLEKFLRNNRGAPSDETLFEQSMEAIRELCSVRTWLLERFLHHVSKSVSAALFATKVLANPIFRWRHLS